MWIKFWSACLLVTLVNAEYLYDSNPYAHFGGYASSYDNYKPTNYKFEYGVSDPHTGDHKSQWEVKENGVVRGAYSLLEPDGTTRLVEYYADDTGFHADVKKLGTAIHAAPEYGQLHSLSETHIANSLAYNGYGHGGVSHNYGAPIAAAVKVAAAPIPVHHAPIAQVQHIAPVPQVIAPQIHHLGSPHDFGYGQEISHIYSSAPEAHYHDHHDHHEKVYAAPVPVLQHPAPFKIHAEPHYEQAPIIKEYTPAIAHYAEPQIVKQVVQPVVKYAQAAPAPEYYANYAPEPAYVKYAAAPAPIVAKYPEPVYAHAQEYIQPQIYAAPAPAPAPVAKVAVAGKVQAVNPFARFFAPFAKYFAAPAPTVKTVVAPAKVVPTQAVYAEAPVKYVDYDAYQGYKPEVVISSPHNYGPNPGYSYSHDY
ncbi:cuticle protein-like [Atheta coriaria]|uniref:cuticle protein-like n=1 Tax=Dalotia coriaria TaxID=877792 RepID=UPI0031F425AD